MIKKILFFAGTRPEIIKLAPLFKAFKKNKKFDTFFCCSYQHKEMAIQALSIFDIQPDFSFEVMKAEQDLFHITKSVLDGAKNAIETFEPDIVFVQGDTSTAFSAALAAFYKQVNIYHIEAGLRTFDLSSPYPEEMNRKFITCVATHHFAPTELALKNLLNEGVDQNSISVVGNTVVDAIRMISNLQDLDIDNELLSLGINRSLFKGFFVITMHRRESVECFIDNFCDALKVVSESYKDYALIYPMHPNPKIKKVILDKLQNIDNLYIVEPLGYEKFIAILRSADVILSDSGGIQEEASALGIPIVILRENTERGEILNTSMAKIAGMNTEKILISIKSFMKKKSQSNFLEYNSLFGDGDSSVKIVDIVSRLSKTV
jgi:UDP-N-acetylglucosamine 2-epimerase (non-hydrolysing)